MTAETLLQKQKGDVYSVRKDVLIHECVSLMNEKRVGALCVLDKTDTLCGIISERDILWLIEKTDCQIADIPVKEVMTPKDKIISVDKNDHVAAVMDKMTKNGIRHIVITDNGALLGLASMRDVVSMLLNNALLENKQLMDYVYQSY